MKYKAITIFALMLTVGAFFLPATAYAAADTTPPSVNAWLSGETLHIEAADDNGVESVYVDSRRFNYLVDGAIEVNARDNHDNAEKISVYAVDFVGNKSSVIQITNPYYKAQPVSSTPEPPSDPSPEPTGGGTEQTFTPDGQGSVADNVIQQNGKEFFTITTPDENVFYLVIDRQRDSENVYLLNAVTEDDLMALTQKGNSGGQSQSVIPAPTPEVKQTPEVKPSPTPQPEAKPKKDGGNIGSIIFIVVAALAVGGAGYYFKILKPKKDAPAEDDDYGEDDSDYEDEPGAGEDCEFGEFGGMDDEYEEDAY